MNSSTSSGVKTADGIIYADTCKLTAITLTASGATATLSIYDNASAASGLVLATLSALDGTTAILNLSHPVQANKGLFIDIGGASAACVVHYQPSA